ncbi:MAG TPA: hypothetical protein VGE81_10350 [Candidatus Limnocylindrales bacterium]
MAAVVCLASLFATAVDGAAGPGARIDKLAAAIALECDRLGRARQHISSWSSSRLIPGSNKLELIA